MTALSLSRLSPCVSRRRAQPALASGLEPALAFLAAIWHVLSIFVLTPFPFLEHFPGWEIQLEAAPSGLAASREVCQPGAGRARIGRFRSRLLMDLLPLARSGHCCNGAESMGCLWLPISPGEHSQDSCFFSNLAIPVNGSSSPTERHKEKTLKEDGTRSFALKMLLKTQHHWILVKKVKINRKGPQSVTCLHYFTSKLPPLWWFCWHRKLGHFVHEHLSLPMKDLHTKGKKSGVESGQCQRTQSRGKGSWTAVPMLPCRSQSWQHIRHEEYGIQKS